MSKHLPLLLTVAHSNRNNLKTDERKYLAGLLRPLSRTQKLAAYQRFFVARSKEYPILNLRYAQLTLRFNV